MKEAEHYKILNKREVQCLLCPHVCKLKEKEISICGTRMLVDGKLRALSYGRVIATNTDPVEKKPLYHFLPGTQTLSIGTAGCNLDCKNCQNSDLSNSEYSPSDKTNIFPEDIVSQAEKRHLKSISYTYNEPTVFYELMKDTAKIASEKGIKNIMVSNGYISQKPLKELIPYLNAANIDMKAFNNETYLDITGAQLNPVLKTIETIHYSKTHLEITMLIIPGYTDKYEEISDFFKWMIDRKMENIPIHISRFFPTYKMKDVPPTDTEKIFKIREMALDMGIKHVYPGNVLNTNSHNTYCPDCGNLVVRREGYFVENDLKDNQYCAECGTKVIPQIRK